MQSNDIARVELRTSDIARLGPPKQARVYDVQGLGSKLGVIGHVSYDVDSFQKSNVGLEGRFEFGASGRSKKNSHSLRIFLSNLCVMT